MNKSYFHLILFTLVLHYQGTHAQVTPPNYSFSYEQFTPFMPGQQLNQRHQPELIDENKEFQLFRLKIRSQHYFFKLFVSTKENTIVEMFTRLPSYFLHDVFHQSLINRLGNQDSYKNKNEQSSYIWKDEAGSKHHYEATCTITCFPIFYHVIDNNYASSEEYVSIIKKLESSYDPVPKKVKVEVPNLNKE